jgi:hypothetical protein
MVGETFHASCWLGPCECSNFVRKTYPKKMRLQQFFEEVMKHFVSLTSLVEEAQQGISQEAGWLLGRNYDPYELPPPPYPWSNNRSVNLCRKRQTYHTESFEEAPISNSTWTMRLILMELGMTNPYWILLSCFVVDFKHTFM